jgi:hypothetical protein
VALPQEVNASVGWFDMTTHPAEKQGSFPNPFETPYTNGRGSTRDPRPFVVIYRKEAYGVPMGLGDGVSGASAGGRFRRRGVWPKLYENVRYAARAPKRRSFS